MNLGFNKRDDEVWISMLTAKSHWGATLLNRTFETTRRVVQRSAHGYKSLGFCCRGRIKVCWARLVNNGKGDSEEERHGGAEGSNLLRFSAS